MFKKKIAIEFKLKHRFSLKTMRFKIEENLKALPW